MDIKIPSSKRRKALFVIDVQPQTLDAGVQYIIPRIASFIERTSYDAYVEANYFADEQSMFFKQGGFLKRRDEAGGTALEVRAALEAKTAPRILVEKNTRSCFKCFNSDELQQFLKRNSIEEAHFVGYDINDCVLGSAFEAIDLGYFCYVIEELCHNYEAKDSLREAALAIYRSQEMTNSANHVGDEVIISI